VRRPSLTTPARWKVAGWKAAGLAALLGVAATGAVIARAERHRHAYTPEEIRARLHARHADAAEPAPATRPDAPRPHPAHAARKRTARWPRRRH
jgi:hypothetical protein